MRRQVPTPPPRPTARRPETEITVRLKTVTPILGGSYRTREVDEVDIIRVPTVRGHLRFWWRALHGHNFTSARELYEAEKKLWGGATDTEGEDHARSKVEVRILDCSPSNTDTTDILPYPKQGQPKTPGAYALWPARGTNTVNPAPRRQPGTQFTLSVISPKGCLDEVRKTVLAWILFGGYGSRTRRGVGSLTVVAPNDATWLPAGADRQSLVACFGQDPLQKGQLFNDLPVLAGASLVVGNPCPKAQDAWTRALDWLSDFRQGTKTGARQPGANNRPSISNWPEPDKVRRLSGKQYSHQPRHNNTPVWPRAGFGLPIETRWQKKGRQGETYQEPPDYHLHWQHNHDEHDRLGSPLIVKAMPLAGGQYAPLALWLHRAYPRGGRVVVAGTHPAARNSAADFDVLVAPGDTALFAPLQTAANAPSGQRLRTAFMGWLKQQPGTREVAP